MRLARPNSIWTTRRRATSSSLIACQIYVTRLEGLFYCVVFLYYGAGGFSRSKKPSPVNNSFYRFKALGSEVIKLKPEL